MLHNILTDDDALALERAGRVEPDFLSNFFLNFFLRSNRPYMNKQRGPKFFFFVLDSFFLSLTFHLDLHGSTEFSSTGWMATCSPANC
jgi:hypothetical protein